MTGTINQIEEIRDRFQSELNEGNLAEADHWSEVYAQRYNDFVLELSDEDECSDEEAERRDYESLAEAKLRARGLPTPPELMAAIDAKEAAI